MAKLIDRPSRLLAATALFGALILAAPSQAQTSTSPSTSASQSPVRKAVAAKPASVDQRIKELHAKLHITADQEPKWATVAQVMQDNAAKVEALARQRSQNLKTMSAIDDLKSYRDIAQAHADGMQALITAFEDVYNTMTPDQQKNADSVFAQAQGRRQARKSTKGS